MNDSSLLQLPRIKIGRITLYRDVHTEVMGELIYDLDRQEFFVVADESGRLIQVTVEDEILPQLFQPEKIASMSFEYIRDEESEELILAPLEDIL